MRTILYCRVSTQKQADSGVSLADQKKRLEAYAVAMGLTVAAVIEDRGESAGSLDRPGVVRAVAMLEAGDADALLVCKLDRLTRSVRDLGTLIDRFFGDRPTTRAARLMSLDDSIDTRSAGGRLVLNVLASVSQWEREAIAERTRAAMAHLKSQGVRLGAAPLDDAATITRAKELRSGGLSYRAVAAKLDEENRRTKSGKPWSAMSVKRVCDRRAA